MNKVAAFPWFVTPFSAMTKNSKYKIVRALGDVISYTIMLPWFIVSALFVGICWFLMGICWFLYEFAIKDLVKFLVTWWKNV